MERSNSRIIAGLLFAAFVIWNFKDIFQMSFFIWNYIELLGYILIVVFCFSGVYALLKAGCAMEIISAGYFLLNFLMNQFRYDVSYLPVYYIVHLLVRILMIAIWVALFVGAINAGNMKGLGFVSAGMTIARFVLISIANVYMDWSISFTSALWHILLAGCMLFVCESFTARSETLTVNNVKQQTAGEGTAEKLIKLKALLDEGVITQNEFDAEKKRLINL